MAEERNWELKIFLFFGSLDGWLLFLCIYYLIFKVVSQRITVFCTSHSCGGEWMVVMVVEIDYY
jgi:hypothetical protein